MKNVPKLVALLLVLAMVLGMAACGSSEPATDAPAADAPAADAPAADAPAADIEQVFYTYTGSEPATFDPWINNSGAASIFVAATHEPFLRRANNEQGWEPGLCTDYTPNADYTEHTVTLREGAKWEDGTDITMDDVIASFQRVLNPETASAIAYKYFEILNAEAYYLGEVEWDEVGIKADGQTLTFTTTNTCTYFLELLCGSKMAPISAAAAAEFGTDYGTDVGKMLASGPFKLTEWTHTNSFVLEKNENYWDAENVALERIEVTITSDSNTIQGMYLNDELSIMKVSDDLLAQYADENIYDNVLTRVTFIEFNPANKFMGNIKIREALSIAFNRTLFAEQVMGNASLAAYGMVPYGVTGVNGGDFREQQGNLVKDATDAAEIERAKQLLAEGLAELGATVEEMQEGFTVQCLESGKTQAEFIQACWKQNLGVEMPVSVMDINVLLPLLVGGTFDCVIGGGQDSDYCDPQGFMQFIYDENKWDNEEFRSLVELAHTQVGDERIETWMQIEKMVLENFIYIPQVYAMNHWAIKDGVEGLEFFVNGHEMDFKHVEITK